MRQAQQKWTAGLSARNALDEVVDFCAYEPDNKEVIIPSDSLALFSMNCTTISFDHKDKENHLTIVRGHGPFSR